MLRKLRRVAGLLCLFIALACLAWGLWPPEESARTLTFTPDPQQFPALAGKQHFELSWTPTVRAGDTGLVQVRLDGRAGPGSAPASGGAPDENVLVEARLELPGVSARPEEDLQSAVLPGRPVFFFWNLSAGQPGIYPGKVWLYLEAVPRAGQEEPQRSLVSALIFEVRSVRLLGLSGGQARALGIGGVILWVLLGIDWLLERLRRVSPGRR